MTYPPQPPNYPPQHGARPPVPPKKSNKVLWIVLAVVGVFLVCGGGFGFSFGRRFSAQKSSVQQIKALAQDYKSAEDAKDAAKLAGMLCSADAADAGEILESDQKVAPGGVDIKGVHVMNSVGAVGFTDSKEQGWTIYFRKEGDQWKACPSVRDEFNASDTTTTTTP